MSDSFEVKIPLFEGPFDLLLFFIRRDELDIHDIPIAKITNDFVAYIRHLEKLNMEVASEFILVASTLMRIKAKMLLPRVEKDEEGNEIDPREDLVQHLLEYKKYKSVVGDLEKMEDGMVTREKRGNVLKEIKKLSSINDIETELQDIDLYKVLKIFQKVMFKFENKPVEIKHQVVPYPYKIETQKEVILDKLKKNEKISFSSLIDEIPERIAVIFNFLAILELLAYNKISLILGEGFNNFWVIPIDNATENIETKS
ncbi:MAG: chromosome segregation protein ScpA [Thalassobius sp.]|nr:chromosome segregation protein ScpA [Thalassovita sp.]